AVDALALDAAAPLVGGGVVAGVAAAAAVGRIGPQVETVVGGAVAVVVEAVASLGLGDAAAAGIAAAGARVARDRARVRRPGPRIGAGPRVDRAAHLEREWIEAACAERKRPQQS